MPWSRLMDALATSSQVAKGRYGGSQGGNARKLFFRYTFVGIRGESGLRRGHSVSLAMSEEGNHEHPGTGIGLRALVSRYVVLSGGLLCVRAGSIVDHLSSEMR
jgi:hypothetical protein